MDPVKEGIQSLSFHLSVCRLQACEGNPIFFLDKTDHGYITKASERETIDSLSTGISVKSDVA